MTDPEPTENKFAANLAAALTGPAAPFPDRYLSTLHTMYERSGEDHYVRLIAATLDSFVQTHPVATADTACDLVPKTSFRSPGYVDLLASAGRSILLAYDRKALPLDDAGDKLHQLYDLIAYTSYEEIRRCNLDEERTLQLHAIGTVTMESLLTCARESIRADDPTSADSWARAIWESSADGAIRTAAGTVRLDAAAALLCYDLPEAASIAQDMTHGTRGDPLQERACAIVSRCGDGYRERYGQTGHFEDLQEAGNCFLTVANAAQSGTALHKASCLALVQIAPDIWHKHPLRACQLLGTVVSASSDQPQIDEAARILGTIEDKAARDNDWPVAVGAAAVQALQLPPGDDRQEAACCNLLDYTGQIDEKDRHIARSAICSIYNRAPADLQTRMDRQLSEFDAQESEQQRKRDAAAPRRPSLSAAEADALIAKLRTPKADAAKPG